MTTRSHPIAVGTGTIRAVGNAADHAAPHPGDDHEEGAVQVPHERFQQLTLLGRGSYGTVYKALDTESNRTVALKNIPLDDGDNDISMIEEEISLLQSCDHPNIVKYLGSWHTDAALWIAMEYCGGGSVSDLMHASGQPLSEPLVSYVCSEALRGLVYLHGMGKLHRDIKCGNILLTERGEVKLADFGVAAQLTDTKSKRNTFIGTPHWMAPEVIQESRYDGKVDIWALGISAIEMAEVSPPRWSVHPMRVIFMISRDPPPTLSEREKWSLAFSDFVAQCLYKDPKARPPAKHLMQHKFIARTPPEAQAQLVPLIAAAMRVAEARGPRDLQAPPSHEGADAAAGYGGAGGAGPAKGPWNRTSAGWGRFAGLAIGARQVGASPRADAPSQQHDQQQHDPSSSPPSTYPTPPPVPTYVDGTVRMVDTVGGTMQGGDMEEGGYGGTVAVHTVRRGEDDYTAALHMAQSTGVNGGYAEAVASVANEGTRAAGAHSGGPRAAGDTAALEERLHAMYMGENVIPLPLLRASAAAALVLKPYPETPGSHQGGGAGGEEGWVQVLADVALESYSEAPGRKPDRAHAIPPEALQQVRNSPGLLNLVKILAYHKRMAQEEVLTPDALKHVQSQIHDLSDTLKTILCL